MRRLTFCLAFIGGTAHATPPNVVTINDIYLGASADQVFLLRTINDNLGVYTQSALDIYLLARSKTGTMPDEAWPLRRKISYNGDEGQPDQNIPINNAVDPFAIMAEKGAWPGPTPRTRDLPQITYDPAIITFQSTAYEGWEETPVTYEFNIGFDAAMAQLTDSHAATRAVLEQHAAMDGGTDSIYYFHPESFAAECEPLASGHLYNNGKIDALLVEYNCTMKYDGYIGARVYLVVPMTRNSS